MSEQIVISLIAAIGSVLCVAITGLLAYLVARLKVQINSRMDELLDAARKAGNVEGRQELTDENLKNKQ